MSIPKLHTFFFSIFLTLLLKPMSEASQSSPKSCGFDTGPVVESTPLISFLQTLQNAALKSFGPKDFDPKRYVDLSLKPEFDLKAAEIGFEILKKSDNGTVGVDDLSKYIVMYFNEAGDDLKLAVPEDYLPEPVGFLPAVKNEKVMRWALQVHSLWKNLSRRVSEDVEKHHEKHTLLPLPEMVIIPGSRFREVYYWDSYWVIRGLLVSKMFDTAKGIVSNLISLLETYGYVLNGARGYYTNRSQPPLLSAMVHAIYQRTHDIDFVKRTLPALVKEHEFWTSGFHEVMIQDAEGAHHSLSRYYAKWNQPRPESSTIDMELASRLSNDCEKQHLYREVATTAETGWDFSTRWMKNTSDMTTLATTTIVPVDLNVFILGMELNIASLANVTADHRLAKHFSEASQMRKRAITAVLWNEEKEQWSDYWLSSSHEGKDPEKWNASRQNQNVFASNFIPLWLSSFNSDDCLVEKVMKSLQQSGLIQVSGLATSLTPSGQQWDYPNGWPPVEHMIIEGLASSNLKAANSLAKEISIRWIKTNFVAFKETGAMHEKYDVTTCGGFGGGGEYVPQTGFGWSNGVVLALLEEFGWAEHMEIDDHCQQNA